MFNLNFLGAMSLGIALADLDGAHCIDEVGYTSDLWGSSCFCLLNVGITSMHH